ncbi:MBL fold metallo-hydrolase [Bacillus sp. SCS-151]|uniref:MBL fold metallo-hydrolase n=1 Tax=Nanhaiella sioensis TaxID=3115293 RepID=UPI00397B5981
MNWEQIPLGPLQTNAYILRNEQNECIIFDPGSEGDSFNELLTRKSLQPLAIVLTHAHFDHIGAVEDVRKKWGVPVYIHKAEQDWLTNASLNGSAFFSLGAVVCDRPADVIIDKEQQLTIGSFHFTVFETPGHSPGSLSFYCESIKTVFSGDTLFAGSIGRTDLPGGDHQQLLDSIHAKLLSLPEDTIVLAGHGPETTIEIEMSSNPFLNGF